MDNIKRLIETAKTQAEIWDEDHLEKLLILCFQSFRMKDTEIFKVINGLKMFTASLLMEMIDKHLITIESAWKQIFKLSKKKSKFLKMFQSAVENDIPIFLKKLNDIDVLKSVNASCIIPISSIFCNIL